LWVGGLGGMPVFWFFMPYSRNKMDAGSLVIAWSVNVHSFVLRNIQCLELNRNHTTALEWLR
jgi:hypothetical protein